MNTSNPFVKCVAIFAIALVVSISVVAFARHGAAKLSKSDAKNLIRRFAGGDFGGDNVAIVGEVSNLGTSAVVEAEIKTAFRFARETGKWRVAEVRVGDRDWQNLSTFEAALTNEKRGRVELELELMRAALESYARERGGYVVADNHAVLIDHLAPQYLARVIRLDAWNRAYKYLGTRTAFTLSSDGADGESSTADDVRLTNR